MEPLVKTICCTNCGEALIAFLDAPTAECEACGFSAEIFADRDAALARFRSYERDAAVIVSDPVQISKSRWVVAHTKLFLV